jgi:hypothetical protein
MFFGKSEALAKKRNKKILISTPNLGRGEASGKRE